jgi:hypothetical protein
MSLPNPSYQRRAAWRQAADPVAMSMRPDSRPVTFTINLPSLTDEAVIEIQDFLFEILELFETHYGHQIQRFLDDYSGDNIVYSHPPTNAPDDDPHF